MGFLAKIGRGIIGVLFIGIGIAAIAYPAESFAAMSWLWAILLVVSGIVSIIVFVAVGPKAPGRGFILFGGIAQLILGMMLVNNGIVFTTIVALNVLQIWIIFSGIEGIVGSFEEKRLGIKTWWLTLILGIICLLIGLSSFSSAVFNTTLLAPVVGIGLIASGVSSIAKTFLKQA